MMTRSDVDARIAFGKRLARDAGALARRYFVREIAFSPELKSTQDWVSGADHAVEAFIRERLAAAFPDDTMLGEESGGEIGVRAWCVDPIDGTINFIHGVRYWCVSLAFLIAGERQIGIIYDPSLDELFWATRGGGAYSDDTRLSISPRDRLDHALVCLGYVPRHPLETHLALKRRLHEAGVAVKDMGAGALMLAHVAAGRYDAFVEPHMNPWDALAGLLLVEEAGGRVSPYPSYAGLLSGAPVVAAAPGIYDALYHLMQES